MPAASPRERRTEAVHQLPKLRTRVRFPSLARLSTEHIVGAWVNTMPRGSEHNPLLVGVPRTRVRLPGSPERGLRRFARTPSQNPARDPPPGGGPHRVRRTAPVWARRAPRCFEAGWASSRPRPRAAAPVGDSGQSSRPSLTPRPHRHSHPVLGSLRPRTSRSGCGPAYRFGRGGRGVTGSPTVNSSRRQLRHRVRKGASKSADR